MTYTSFVFIIFLAASCLIYYLVPKKAQWVVLLAASLVFYIISCKELALVMAASALTVYGGALGIQRLADSFKQKREGLDKVQRKELKAQINKKKKALLSVVVVLNIATLALLKYCNFFGSIINWAAGIFKAGQVIPAVSIILPLGISYYTLMAVSYIVDVYRGKIEAERNYFRLLLFVCYFPHIMEGPFDRYDKLNEQFRQPHFLDLELIRSGAVLLMWGLFKKLVIADRAGLIAAGIFDNADSLSGTSVIIAMLAYTLQIYADFSGCIEIVSGASELFGIKIAENFRQPFLSRSINEFWRRWHITLGLWLKEYVFYPVSLSSGFKRVNTFVSKHIKSQHLVKLLPAAYALLFVWLCNGIWHGAGGKYIFYGLYYYALMMLGELAKPVTDRLISAFKINTDSKLYHFWQGVRTFVIVNFGMLIFRSTTVQESTHLFCRMFSSVNLFELFTDDFTIEHISNKDYLLLALCVVLLAVIGILKEKGTDIRTAIFSKPIVIRWALYLALIFATIIFGMYGGDFGNAAMIYGEF